MVQAIVTDFSRVLLFPVDKTYQGGLNPLNNRLLAEDPDYDFWQYFKLNKELLEYYKSLDLPVYIFTSETIQNHPAVKDMLSGFFKGVISAKNLGAQKTDSAAYSSIAKELEVQAEDLLYIDDKQENIDAAQSAGCKTVLYKSNEETIDEIVKRTVLYQ
jgi:HAD superfamily hydrolase (TIGR01509 family)